MDVTKTYKLFIGGAFVRSESGRYFKHRSDKSDFISNLPRASRKDLRNSVHAARAAQSSWSERTAYNRSQIIYRIAEILQPEEEKFIQIMKDLGISEKDATENFAASIDEIVSLAGWCDKYSQVTSSVNPVASSHFNFSIPEPTGVVCLNLPNSGALLHLIRAMLPPICGGNTIVCIADNFPALALDFAEVLSNSDMPAGVVNILSGTSEELAEHISKHMDINATHMFDMTEKDRIEFTEFGSENMKRMYFNSSAHAHDSLRSIMKFQEIKTTWHPIDRISRSGSSY